MTRPIGGGPAGGDPGGDGGGGASTGRTAWVDAVNGSDGTGTAGESALPFATHAAALTAVAALAPPASATDPAAVLAYPGEYIEAPLTVPAFVTMHSMAGSASAVLVASTTTAALVTLEADGVIEGYTARGASGVGGIGWLSSGRLGAPMSSTFSPTTARQDSPQTGQPASFSWLTRPSLHASSVSPCRARLE